LILYPEAGDSIPGAGGLRKLRFADRRRGKGRRGGLRVIYYWWDSGSQFWLFTIYDKRPNGRPDTSATQDSQRNDQGRIEIKEKTMKRAVKTKVVAKPKRASKRDLFAELSEGIKALAETRQGKRTLRTHRVAYNPAPTVKPEDLIRLRGRLKISRALFAVYLRTNVRTIENWEQGRAEPNAQAALLINLVKRYPDTIERLASI
jgi:putative transcriptional regulator